MWRWSSSLIVGSRVYSDYKDLPPAEVPAKLHFPSILVFLFLYSSKASLSSALQALPFISAFDIALLPSPMPSAVVGGASVAFKWSERWRKMIISPGPCGFSSDSPNRKFGGSTPLTICTSGAICSSSMTSNGAGTAPLSYSLPLQTA